MDAIKYADDLLKLIGFKHIADYESVVYYDQITLDTINQVNSTMSRFKPLFKQREFNLARYKYQLSTTTQLLGFVRKILQQLDVNHEIIRHRGQNAIRLKPQNNLLQKYIMNQEMSSGSQSLLHRDNCTEPKSQVPLKVKTMSSIVQEYLSKDEGQRGTEVVTFYESVVLNGIKSLRDIITSIHCSHDCTLMIDNRIVCKIPSRSALFHIYLPLSLLTYHHVKIVANDPVMLTHACFKVASLNKFRFNIDDYAILLDDIVFASNWKVYNGMSSCFLGTPQPVHPLDQPKPLTRKMVIRNTDLTVMDIKIPCGENEVSYAITQLIQHHKHVNAIKFNMNQELTLSYMLNGTACNYYNLYYIIPRLTDVILNIKTNVAYTVKVYGDEEEEVKVTDGSDIEIFHDKNHATMLVIENVPIDRLYSFRTHSVTITGLCIDLKQRKRILLKEGM